MQRFVTPKKSLGQNFLRDRFQVERIVEALAVQPTDVFLEIGPGEGVLTDFLLRRAREVVAVELDQRLMELLRERFAGVPNFRLLHGDFLKLNPARWDYSELRIVGNIPYHITSSIIFQVFQWVEQPEAPHIRDLFIMMQREVARRVTAAPGGKDYGILSVFSTLYAHTDQVLQVPPGAFYPVPKVESSVVRFRFREQPLFHLERPRLFRQVVKVTFNQRRKQLRNSLGAVQEFRELLPRLKFDLTRRPEQLGVQDFYELYRQIAEAAGE